MRKLGSIVCAIALAGVGCGGGGGDAPAVQAGPPAMPGMANTAVLMSSTVQADTLRTQLAAKNGPGVLAAAMALSFTAQAGVTAAAGSKALTTQAAALDVTTADMTSGSASCTETSCTFTNATVSMGQSFTINGSVSWKDLGAAREVTWKLTGTGNVTGESPQGAANVVYNYNWNGDLTVSETSLVGEAGATWSGSGTANGQSFAFDYGAYIKFDGVTYANHAAAGGTIYGKSWVTVNAGGQTQTRAYEATYSVK